jgi:hypothetical protein
MARGRIDFTDCSVQFGDRPPNNPYLSAAPNEGVPSPEKEFLRSSFPGIRTSFTWAHGFSSSSLSAACWHLRSDLDVRELTSKIAPDLAPDTIIVVAVAGFEEADAEPEITVD